jgi:hypothetical protein
MGYSKVVKLANGRGVKFVHQLDQDGTAYAEDITVEVQPGVDPEERLRFFLKADGAIGYASINFVRAVQDAASLREVRFPDE